MNHVRFFLHVLLVSAPIGALSAFAQGLIVYKHVDSAGRTTYSNQSIKGAVAVELTPLSVLPKSKQSAAAPVARIRPTETQPRVGVTREAMSQQPANLPFGTADTPSVQIEKNSSVSPVPSPAMAMSQTDLTTDARCPTSQVSTINTSPIIGAQQRREDVRRRIVEVEIDAETQLLAEAQGYLQREQTKSVAMRSLRAAVVFGEQADGKQPLRDDILATKKVVERHFERVRELQDQVLMHEENLAELRVQLRTAPQRSALKNDASVQPTAFVTTAQLGSGRGN